MNRGLSNTTKYQRPYGIVKGVIINRLMTSPPPIKNYCIPAPSAPSSLKLVTKVIKAVTTPLEYISCSCPDSHEPSSFALQCLAKEPHVMVIPKNFVPPPFEKPMDWKLIRKLNKLSRPQPPKNQRTHSERVYNAVGEYEAFTVPITKDKDGPLEHHYINVFPEMIEKVKYRYTKKIQDMIENLIILAVDRLVIKKLLDDVEKYKVTKDEDPVNVFDIFCCYTYAVSRCIIDDLSAVYKVLVIIKQGIVNLWQQSGMKKSERQWFLMLNNLSCMTHDNAMNKIAAEIEHVEMKLVSVRNNIRDAGDEEECGLLWKQFAELKSIRNDLNQKKKKLLTVLL